MYHSPRKPFNATRTNESAKVTAHKICVTCQDYLKTRSETTHLCKPINLDVQEPNLSFWMASIHHGTGFRPSIDDKTNSRASREYSIGPEYILRSQWLDRRYLHHRHIVHRMRRRTVNGESSNEGMDVLDRRVG